MVLNDAGVIGYSLNGKSFPATAPYTASVGDWVLIHYLQRGHPDPPDAPAPVRPDRGGQGRLPARRSPTRSTPLNVAPGERYSVLVNLDAAGAWVWHCHILPHVEREDGMFGMVTAIIVE